GGGRACRRVHAIAQSSELTRFAKTTRLIAIDDQDGHAQYPICLGPLTPSCFRSISNEPDWHGFLWLTVMRRPRRRPGLRVLRVAARAPALALTRGLSPAGGALPRRPGSARLKTDHVQARAQDLRALDAVAERPRSAVLAGPRAGHAIEDLAIASRAHATSPPRWDRSMVANKQDRTRPLCGVPAPGGANLGVRRP